MTTKYLYSIKRLMFILQEATNDDTILENGLNIQPIKRN
ncbi:hypothetical protein SAMN06265376_103404 [Dokdonia pacifica]|uniref:Uncharacterized protein n=1 Tax=Dokdonia pacifica TaxID=1627892 RepID=A0A238ZR78_9FLAO|nr:hypothetical protein SAMN06265376_103404 [Dokdonia pacifica]